MILIQIVYILPTKTYNIFLAIYIKVIYEEVIYCHLRIPEWKTSNRPF